MGGCTFRSFNMSGRCNLRLGGVTESAKSEPGLEPSSSLMTAD